MYDTQIAKKYNFILALTERIDLYCLKVFVERTWKSAELQIGNDRKLD